ncbi:hypothetical protein conserved [Leishmania donovani]|uniref:Uncharacterized protein n=3 Tax=Leishmania donovani species complex TaxID=38574 RepID=A4I2H7_LEIIN|nr:conserved hypothetical protein [Leishmania infantum JPCM5]XP_003861842.1 hypothetical protein, conserved [Leishmania donovani]CAC9497875.1 hypothetical_protein_-_conserved [Leishmania infantum]AYU79861.1 hypothetical protein LdCL_260031700 [Leishmania donovani]CAJ1989848.1 hypothetical protein conserved [Leishmania donovani]CAM68969.1 conserved hypothetical protein [Leishmania infantum JPCM5]CBZ35145.1 hypothetical protein, conserved [Leishmania donovani]|eukprot:XP_001470588.1 conserved hypothetical protein [Leishmania infantum JPCM5]
MVTTVKVEIPRESIMKPSYMDDVYLLNQFDGVNDNPQEDGLPLRKWILREVHEVLAKNPRKTEVVVKLKSDKSARTEFAVAIIGDYVPNYLHQS